MAPIANNKLMVSMYKSFSTNLGDKDFIEIIQDIKDEKYQSDISSIRYALHKELQSEADNIKSKLPAFTTSATFGKSRTKDNIKSYSQMLCLDYDYVPIEKLSVLIFHVNTCEYTLASFISPSGKGLKVFVKINSDAEQHSVAYQQVADFYQKLSGFEADAKCKDITRLCFVSSDSACYLDESSKVFKVTEEKIIPPTEIKARPKKQSPKEIPTDTILDKCLKFTEEKEQYYQGNRNNFIHLFASNANRFGILQDETLNFCITNFDLDEAEITASIKSAYKLQSAQFAKYADYANRADTVKTFVKPEVEKHQADEEDYLLNTPTIPQSVYDALPYILKKGAEAFTEQRERDTFLTTALGIISGCLPNVTGEYHGRTVYPQLYVFVLAPAASGKGAMQSSKELAKKYQDEVLKNSIEKKKEYDNKLEEVKNINKYKKKGEQMEEFPEKPPFKVVFIPANTSIAKIIEHLQVNEGPGIICETEADTLGTALKADWGGYSDVLRKAFHNECISSSKKTNNEYIEINNPQLAVALSGTPKQVYNIIKSAEDGLFSRFIFYQFKTNSKWLDPSPFGGRINLTDHFAKLSITVYEMTLFLNESKTKIHLTEQQWAKFNPIFEEYLNNISAFVSDEAQSVVKRLGLILYRICMILTTLRKFEAKIQTTDVTCCDEDFEVALQLVDVYLKHSILMYEKLPKQEVENTPFKSGQNKRLFFEALPDRFLRKEAIQIATKFNMAERTVSKFLKDCLGKYLEQPEYGVYKKLKF